MRRPPKTDTTMHLTARKGGGGGAAADCELAAIVTHNCDASLDSNDSTPKQHNHHHHHSRNSSQESTGDDENPNSKLTRGNFSHSKYSLIRMLRKVRYQWALLSCGSKIAATVLIVILFQHVVLGTIDVLFHRMGESKGSIQSSSPAESFFAVAINTYKRPDMLRDAVQHYADTCGKRFGVGQVFVIWAEQNSIVPEPSSFFASAGNLRDDMGKKNENRALVYVLQKEKDSLNSRFEPIAQLQTTSVLMVDDDLRIACSSLVHGFHAWNAHPESMVGYYPRLASPPRRQPPSGTDSQLIYHTWPVVFFRHQFNLVLTKAAFLHSKYLALYSGRQFPQEIRDHVDKHMNCEDIAMSMLVANYTRYKNGSPAPPIFVEGAVYDKGLIGGISTGSGHMATRSQCLTELTKLATQTGWNPPLDYQLPLGGFSWLKHAPGFWWQFRPSNIFEWLALENTFT